MREAETLLNETMNTGQYRLISKSQKHFSAPSTLPFTWSNQPCISFLSACQLSEMFRFYPYSTVNHFPKTQVLFVCLFSFCSLPTSEVFSLTLFPSSWLYISNKLCLVVRSQICFSEISFFNLLQNCKFSKSKFINVQTAHHKQSPSLQQQKQPWCVLRNQVGISSASTEGRKAMFHRVEPPGKLAARTWCQKSKERSEVEHAGILRAPITFWKRDRNSQDWLQAIWEANFVKQHPHDFQHHLYIFTEPGCMLSSE